ncbi:hypothetical protein, partial [Dickeya sp. NCPPB 3274]|uniref:hypothetical protein n=1 Tax=Dickeya sp. NCPPB 3274 TaxID=568766 RepID=UPI001EE65239
MSKIQTSPCRACVRATKQQRNDTAYPARNYSLNRQIQHSQDNMAVCQQPQTKGVINTPFVFICQPMSGNQKFSPTPT